MGIKIVVNSPYKFSGVIIFLIVHLVLKLKVGKSRKQIFFHKRTNVTYSLYREVLRIVIFVWFWKNWGHHKLLSRFTDLYEDHNFIIHYQTFFSSFFSLKFKNVLVPLWLGWLYKACIVRSSGMDWGTLSHSGSVQLERLQQLYVVALMPLSSWEKFAACNSTACFLFGFIPSKVSTAYKCPTT